MTSSLIINGLAASLDQASFAHFHGASVFTTLRSQNCELMLWRRHWNRITSHAHAFGYDLPDELRVQQHLHHELSKSSSDLRIRIIIGSFGYALTIEPYCAPDPAVYNGVTVITSSFVIHPQLGSYKTANSLPYQLALKEAQKQNAFEALLLNHEGYVVDGSRTSLLCVDGNRMTALAGGLAGCMRDEVVSFAADFLEVEERFCKPGQIVGQLLLANSLMGVVPVGAVQSETVARIIERFRMDRIKLDSAP